MGYSCSARPRNSYPGPYRLCRRQIAEIQIRRHHRLFLPYGSSRPHHARQRTRSFVVDRPYRCTEHPGISRIRFRARKPPVRPAPKQRGASGVRIGNYGIWTSILFYLMYRYSYTPIYRERVSSIVAPFDSVCGMCTRLSKGVFERR